MKDDKKRKHAPHAPTVPVTDTAATTPIESAVPAAPQALVEPAEQAVLRLEDEVANLKDRHLRLAAEFDNFRKRSIKERTEAWEKAQAELVLRLIDALDDLTRVTRTDPSQTDARKLHEGMDLVERKFWKELSGLGVLRVDETGVPFDPNVHEAVTTAPAASAAQDHTVGAVLQSGYKLGKQLLRPARVQVLTWSGDGAQH
jgi:molecular chaperone GrpE